MALGQTVTEDNDDDDDDDEADDDDQNNKEKGKNKGTNIDTRKNIKRSSTDSNNKDLEPTKRISL